MQLTPSAARTGTLSTQSNSGLIKCQPCVRLVPGDVKMRKHGPCSRGPGMPMRNRNQTDEYTKKENKESGSGNDFMGVQ